MSAALPTVSGGILSNIITWVRRIIKTPSDQSISDETIADYINRFYVYDLAARLQLFELKRQYTFETVPNIFEYQFPYQQYQMILPPAYCDGIQLGYTQSDNEFYKIFPELILNEQPLLGDGTSGPYTVNFGKSPILRGFIDDLGNLLPYVYINAIDTSGEQRYIVDNGEGLLFQTDETFQNLLTGDLMPSQWTVAESIGTVDYILGTATFDFTPYNIPGTSQINTITSPYSSGFPRFMLFFNNTIKLYPVPSLPHKIQVDCYITPAQFLATNSAVPFAYMSEYIARGAARKILSDNADYDQFQFYEPLFREQENLVIRRTDRQNSNMRTPTIFSAQTSQNPYLYTQY